MEGKSGPLKGKFLSKARPKRQLTREPCFISIRCSADQIQGSQGHCSLQGTEVPPHPCRHPLPTTEAVLLTVHQADQTGSCSRASPAHLPPGGVWRHVLPTNCPGATFAARNTSWLRPSALVPQHSLSTMPACVSSVGSTTSNILCDAWSWNSNTLATWCEELTHWKRPWCWQRLKAGGEGDDRGWDGWMASPTQWTWVWVNSRSWGWTGRPGVLQSMGSQRVGQDWATELNWHDVLGWPKSLFRIFYKMWKNANELFGQPNTCITFSSVTPSKSQCMRPGICACFGHCSKLRCPGNFCCLNKYSKGKLDKHEPPRSRQSYGFKLWLFYSSYLILRKLYNIQEVSHLLKKKTKQEKFYLL